MNRFHFLVARLAFVSLGLAATSVSPVRAAIEPAPARQLSNGITLVTRADRTSPRVAFSILIESGANDESLSNAGWRRLAVDATLRGVPAGYGTTASASDAAALSKAAYDAGGVVGATVAGDYVEFFANGTSEHNAELLKLALTLARHPRLSDADIDGARDALVEQVTAQVADPAAKTEAALRGQLYRNAGGELTAYGLSDAGTVDSLKALSDDQLRDLVHSRFSRARIVVAAAGDVDLDAIYAVLNSQPAAKVVETPAPYFQAQAPGQPALIVREFPTPAAWVFVSYSLPGARPEDAPALRVLTAALCDSAKSRLPARLLPRGLVNDPDAALSVAGLFTPRRYAGEIALYAQTSPQGVDHVKNAFLDEIHKLQQARLSPQELASAKLYLRGAWPLERESLRDRAFHAALALALGMSDDTTWPAKVEQVSAADVQRVAKTYLSSYAVALVMPQG